MGRGSTPPAASFHVLPSLLESRRAESISPVECLGLEGMDRVVSQTEVQTNAPVERYSAGHVVREHLDASDLSHPCYLC